MKKGKGYIDKAKGSAAQRRVYAQKKAFIDAHKANAGCARCDERDVRCLDLHHRDPGTKNRKFSYRRRTFPTMSWVDIEAELVKCDVLCSNCHRKEHG